MSDTRCSACADDTNHAGHKNIGLTGSSGRVANRETQLKTLVQLLMEPAGRQAQRRATGAIHKWAANLIARQTVGIASVKRTKQLR